MGVGGAGTNPAANYKQRFRGGFDYNVTNQVSNITDTVPLSNAVVQGLRGVQGGLIQVASAISRQDSTMDSLANTQARYGKGNHVQWLPFPNVHESAKRHDLEVHH